MPSAAILAGGHATRFGGRDKSAILVDGRSILLRQVEELSQLADDILIVGSSGRVHESGPIARVAQAAGASIRVVPDTVPGCGPLGGLDAALASARHDLVVVVACDMPFVTAGFLGALLSLANANTGDEVDAVVPRTEDGYHPLCAVYTRACRPAVARRLAGGQFALKALLADLRVRVMEGDAVDKHGDRARLLANVNTPAALAAVVDRRNHTANAGLQRHET